MDQQSFWHRILKSQFIVYQCAGATCRLGAPVLPQTSTPGWQALLSRADFLTHAELVQIFHSRMLVVVRTAAADARSAVHRKPVAAFV